MAFFLKEALRSLGRNAAPSLAAAITVLITTLVLGVFVPVMQSATGKANEVRNQIQLEAELSDDASQVQIVKLQREIDAMPHVKSVEFRSKEQNRNELTKAQIAATKELPKNPIPATLRIKLDDPAKVAVVDDRLRPVRHGKRKPYTKLITKILNKEDESSKILSATSTIKLLLGVLAAILVLASMLLVANTIRLSIFARRREVEVMKLVGATNWFIRWPFVIEGVIVGVLGGAAAVLLLFIAKRTVIDPWSDKFALVAAPETISFPLLALVLLATAVAVSAAGSGVTLRRFLRV